MATLPKILHVSTPQSWRGGEQQLAYLMEELERLGITPLAMTPTGSALSRFCQQKQWQHQTALKKGGLPLSFAKALSLYANQKQVNVVHAHDSHAHTACILAATFWGLKLPVVLSRRVDFPVGQSALSRYKYNHPQVKQILCVSEAIQEIVRPSIQRPERLKVVYSGVDLQKFPTTAPGHLRKEFGLSPDIPLIGNVAALADHKDHFTFLRTAKLLINQGFKAHFFIIGDGELRAELEAFSQAENLQEQVTFTGFRANVTELLPELDYFLFTSKTEGLGTSILDAFAAKVPVVATAGGGIPELVKHQETGLLAPVKDADLLAKHLQKLISNDSLRDKLTKNALKWVQKFSKKETARQTLLSYQELLN